MSGNLVRIAAEQVFVLFLLILVGFVCTKLGAVVVLLIACPTASNVSLFSVKYRYDETLDFLPSGV